MKYPPVFLASLIGVSALDAGTPALEIARDGTRARITFSGALQAAETVAGPWISVSNPVSLQFWEATEPARFFRALTPNEGGIFGDSSVVSWTLSGPLQTHFNLAFAGSPDGFFPPVRVKPYFDCTLKLGPLTLPVSLRVRGNSSLQECPFPKLKFKVSKEQRAGTPFAGAREIKIGTHCADGGRGNIGRLRDERATYREALAYETMTLLGFVGPQVRRARIDFHDTSPTNNGLDGGWQLERNAVILEDIEVVAERVGGRALSDEEITALRPGIFNVQLLVDLQFLHALLGNWDYSLALDGSGVQNTDVIELADQSLVPVAGDFDLASWVTGEIRLIAPREYHPELPALDRQVRYELDQIRQRNSANSYLSASNRFAAKRTAMELQTASALLDEPGRTNAQQHLLIFFKTLAQGSE